VEIRVLGPLEVVVDGRFFDLACAQARVLVAELVVQAYVVVSTVRLFEVLLGAGAAVSAAY
jgi:hypothetical protein